MYQVSWNSIDPHTGSEVLNGIQFNSDELSIALKFSESLRKRRLNGEQLTFISMASEDPNSVGQGGVDDRLPDGYDWNKRDRIGKVRR